MIHQEFPAGKSLDFSWMDGSPNSLGNRRIFMDFSPNSLGILRMVPQVSSFVVRCRALCGLGAATGALGTAHSNNDLLEAILLEAGVGIGIGNEINSK